MTDWNLGTAARTLWQEARGEPVEGQRAVAHVLLNRRNSGRWGSTLAEVCLSRSQFSAWGPANPKSAQMVENFQLSCRLADGCEQLNDLANLIVAAESKPDPTDGATHYFANSIAAPAWTVGATPCGQFGHQLFFKDVK